jgi:mRNA-degrading endonuclease RelE of RelBE toxin-antitoxin system
MHYNVALSADVKAKIRALPDEIRRSVGFRIFLLEENLAGDVKKLTGSKNQYRLRVGNLRIIFRLEGSTVCIYDIGDRKGIYR